MILRNDCGLGRDQGAARQLWPRCSPVGDGGARSPLLAYGCACGCRSALIIAGLCADFFLFRIVLLAPDKRSTMQHADLITGSRADRY